MDETFIDANALTFAAFVLPPVISLINQRRWPDEMRGLVALGVCVFYSLVLTVVRQDLDWTQWRNVVLQVLVGAFGAYKLFWQPSNIGPRIEAATPIGGRHSVTRSGDTAASRDDAGPAKP